MEYLIKVAIELARKIAKRMQEELKGEKNSVIIPLVIAITCGWLFLPAVYMSSLVGFSESDNPITQAISEVKSEYNADGSIDEKIVSSILFYTTKGETLNQTKTQVKTFVIKYFLSSEISTKVVNGIEQKTTKYFFYYSESILNIIAKDYNLNDDDTNALKNAVAMSSSFFSSAGDFHNYPVAGEKMIMTQGYGGRNIDGNMHRGIDMVSATREEEILAFWKGTVVASSYDSIGGYWVVIFHEKENLYTYYGHLVNYGVPVGTQVKAGDIIGMMGQSGLATGVHLHFEIRTTQYFGSDIDPTKTVFPGGG